ncbi:MAG TPA: malate synthase A, partial [Actinomycetota bacterium]|nr:malate synthase A [Actinomycetota bacterium]
MPGRGEVDVRAPVEAGWGEVLTPAALAFVGRLHRSFEARRRKLLDRRRERQRELDAGVLPTFRPDTRHVREGEWR